MGHKLGIRLVTSAATIALVFVLGGCGQKDNATPNSSAAQHAPDVGISYSVKNGLLVSAETAKFIGLETVEVSERPIQATREIAARVFHAATTNEPQALASAFVSVADAAMFRRGMVSLNSPSTPAAELLRLDHSGAVQTGMVEAILRLNDVTMSLKEGALVTARFAAGDTNAVTVVPNAALFHTMSGDFVYLENGAHFARAAVKPGRTDKEFTEITEGLFAGDKVVIRPVMTLWMTELHNVNGGDACCIKQEAK